MRSTVDAFERFAKVGTLPDSDRVDAKVAKSRDIYRMVNGVDGDTGCVGSSLIRTSDDASVCHDPQI